MELIKLLANREREIVEILIQNRHNEQEEEERGQPKAVPSARRDETNKKNQLEQDLRERILR